MSEPKRYEGAIAVRSDTDTIKILPATVFCADDPAVVERFKKAELYDEGDAEWRAKLEKEYRSTIKTLKAQCVIHGRKADALDKLERIINDGFVELHLEYPIAMPTRVALTLAKGQCDPPITAPSLLEAIESVKEG